MKHFSAFLRSTLSIMLLISGVSLTAQSSKDLSEKIEKRIKNAYSFKTERNPCKVFIGVGTSRADGGLRVDYTVDDTPARSSGVREGDIILALDGIPVKSQFELESERDKHQPGDAFTLSMLRDGKPLEINTRFKSCSKEEMEESRRYAEEREKSLEELRDLRRLIREDVMQQIQGEERPILGIYEGETNESGMVIGSVISGKGAEAAGLQAGDVIVEVNDRSVDNAGDLRRALSGQKAGDVAKVEFVRGGKTLKTVVTLSADRGYNFYKSERDPCKVFIGVYTTTGHEEEVGNGLVRVTGVIDGTPADQSGVREGDVILALDGQAVGSYGELTRERDKHQPGDRFTLTVLRDGAKMNIEARFKECQKSAPAKEAQLAEETQPESTLPREKWEENLPSELSLENLDAYPNPTYGPVRINFEAKAVPTTVRITDMSGKTVYSNNLRQFNGYFNEEVDLGRFKPGVFLLTVEQEGKSTMKKLVLMPRA